MKRNVFVRILQIPRLFHTKARHLIGFIYKTKTCQFSYFTQFSAVLSYAMQAKPYAASVCAPPRLKFIYLFTCKYVCIVLYLSIACHLRCACEGLYVLRRRETALTFFYVILRIFCFFFAFHNSLCFAFSFVTICAQSRSTKNTSNSLSFANKAATIKHIHIQINMHTYAFVLLCL